MLRDSVRDYKPPLRHPVTEVRSNGRMTVGARVRFERESRGISREDLAAAAGIGVSTLSDLELDRSKSTTKLHRIAERLGVRTEWLETGKGPKSPDVQAMGQQPELRPELVIARLQNDIDALRYAVSAVISVMAVYRPIEAADAAKAIRKSVPAKFRDQGFAHELASVLEMAGKPGIAAPVAAPARAKPRSSRTK